MCYIGFDLLIILLKFLEELAHSMMRSDNVISDSRKSPLEEMRVRKEQRVE